MRHALLMTLLGLIITMSAASTQIPSSSQPDSVFLDDLTWIEVRDAIASGKTTVIVPTGAVEQHGPHGPLLTDVLIPQEIARRVAPTVGAVVAPPINATSMNPCCLRLLAACSRTLMKMSCGNEIVPAKRM